MLSQCNDKMLGSLGLWIVQHAWHCCQCIALSCIQQEWQLKTLHVASLLLLPVLQPRVLCKLKMYTFDAENTGVLFCLQGAKATFAQFAAWCLQEVASTAAAAPPPAPPPTANTLEAAASSSSSSSSNNPLQELMHQASNRLLGYNDLSTAERQQLLEHVKADILPQVGGLLAVGTVCFRYALF